MVVGAWYVRALAALGGLAALVPTLAMWGFAVDDALISLRYAHHFASGAGYRFNPAGPSTDGVTPLPWVPLVAPLCRSEDLLIALERAKVIGALAWTLAGVALGISLARRVGNDRRGVAMAVVALGIVALAFPIGAWAASGMETGLATALATLAAASFDRPRRAAVLAGVAAAFRPELAVWALVVAAGASLAAEARPGEPDLPVARRSGTPWGRLLEPAAIAFAPFACCAVVRLVLFGRPAPLALLAKPSDLQHGLVYALAATVAVLTPVLAFAPLAMRGASRLGRTLALAALAHVLVVVAVGGDWMPYARLMVPIAPSLALVFVDTARACRPWSRGGRAALAIALGLALALRAAPAGRHVHEARKELVVRARPLLADAKVVAALDVGWVGAATKANIVDLAGLTDPAIAVLRGGHTSKSVDVGMLLDRDVDAVVVYGEPRVVELRLVRSPLFAERFDHAARIAFGERQTQYYEIFRRRR